MADITEAIRRLIFEYVSEGADKVVQTQEAVAASTTQTDKASLSLEKSFGNLERRYVETVRHQQDYAKVQATVNAAVAQNPALQERANAVLAAASEHFDKAAAGANKGGIAVSFFSKALTTILGPAGLIGIALTALTAAVAYLVDKFQVVPQVLQAVSAALAAVGWGKAAQDVANYAEGMRQAHAATEMQKAALEAIQAIHPTISKDVAKQLQLLDAQLEVAKALTEQDKIIAQEKLKILQGIQQKLKLEEATLIAAKERVIAETNIETATLRSNGALNNTLSIAKQLNVEYDLMGRQIDANAVGYDLMGRQIEAASKAEQDHAATVETAQRATGHSIAQTGQLADKTKEVTAHTGRAADAAEELHRAHQKTGDQLARNTELIRYQVVDTFKLYQQWKNTLSMVEAIGHRMDLMGPSQFKAGGYVSSWDPTNLQGKKEQLIKQYGAENVEVITAGVGLGTYEIAQLKQSYLDEISGLNGLNKKMDELRKSTDTLNTTMQDALSPFYSQDPRTTKLGFRAGVTGNPDWMTGATNANPLVAVLGAGATAPGMADGGSFVVGGGYSANDNKMAVFPVASGEEVVVNRTKQPGAQVVNIDNRIIVTGSIDDDALSKMKVSRYQQAQRMRAGMARA